MKHEQQQQQQTKNEKKVDNNTVQEQVVQPVETNKPIEEEGTNDDVKTEQEQEQGEEGNEVQESIEESDKVEQNTDEAGKREKVEDKEANKEKLEDVPNEKKSPEGVREGDTKLEVPTIEEPPAIDNEKEELRAKLEELEFEREESKATKEYSKLVSTKEVEINNFQQAVQDAMVAGMKAYNIDPNKTFNELMAEDPIKAELARQFVEHAQKRIDTKVKEAQQEIENAGINIAFKRAEREIKKYKLTPEQEAKAAETFVDILCATGVKDLSEDMRVKVKLAVGQAMMEVPNIVNIPNTMNTTNIPDTKTSKIPSEGEEPQKTVEVDKVQDVPPPQEKKGEEEVVLDDYKTSATDVVGGDTIPNPKGVTVDNILSKLAALPYKERVGFMLEYYDIYEEAMRKNAK